MYSLDESFFCCVFWHLQNCCWREASNDAAPSHGGLWLRATPLSFPNIAALQNCCQKFRRKQPSAGSLYEWQYKIATASSVLTEAWNIELWSF